MMEKKLFISSKDIQRRVQELAKRISSDFQGEQPVFIGILNGAVFFFTDLVRQVSIPLKIDFIRAASYGSEMSSSGTVRLTKDVEIPIEGKPVVLVEDIVDTGLTISHIVEAIEARRPKTIKVCTLIDKLERREKLVNVDYCGFKVNEGFIVGYGLDYDEKYRQLPDIYELNP